ncbi:MAG: HAD hydrolase-like protein [Spirochaetes bacterium]|nr:HAD hydrolase-like protein [Spirochaetota bacterium]
MVKHILFDADQTLYPASSGVEAEMIRRMNIFVAEYLGVSVEEAKSLRANRDKKHNSTLEWLQNAKGLDNPEPFLAATHPTDFENFFPKNPALINLLSKITVPCSIFTNSWARHAKNILKYLEISQFFTNIFDLCFNNYFGKPHLSAFTNVLDFLGLEAKDVLFIDDVKKFTDIFHSLGANVILVDELKVHRHPLGIFNKYDAKKYDKVYYIEEIEPILEKLKVI